MKVIYRSLVRGAAGFIPKSVDSKTMLDAIQTTLQTGMFIPDELEGPLNAFRRDYDAYASKLSDKQLDVLAFVAQGLNNTEIAAKLFLSRHAVKYHLTHIFEVFQVNNRADCAAKAQLFGLLEPSLDE